jgi:hypothetical protein
MKICVLAVLLLGIGMANVASACGADVCDNQNHHAGHTIPMHPERIFTWCSCSGNYTIDRDEQEGLEQLAQCPSGWGWLHYSAYKNDAGSNPSVYNSWFDCQ